MSIEAMKQAIEALHEAIAFREGGLQKAIKAVDALRTAIQQAEAKVNEPVNPTHWRAVLSEPQRPTSCANTCTPSCSVNGMTLKAGLRQSWILKGGSTR